MEAENPGLAKLLVSVRDAQEAQLAFELGVPWIDLKEPDAGPLGAPTLSTATAVARVLAGHAGRSVALGELVDLDVARAIDLAKLFPILKVGLSQMAKTNWRQQIQGLANHIETSHDAKISTSQLVPVIYADWNSCLAPSPDSVIAFAGTLAQNPEQIQYVLADTFEKNGLSLLDHVDMVTIGGWIETARIAGCRLLLAGSLDAKQAIDLCRLPIEAVGLRGAVCSENRESQICEKKLARLLSAFRQSSRANQIFNL